MNESRLTAAIIVGWLLAANYTTVLPQNGVHPDSPHLLYSALQAIEFDVESAAEVENLSLKRGDGEFLFKRGKLFFFKPVAGKVTGAVFLGEGAFELDPPDAIERAQTARFLGSDSVRESFSAAYLRFTDSTATQLSRKLTPGKFTLPAAAERLHRSVSDFLLKERHVNLARLVLSELLNDASPFFFAALEQKSVQYNFPKYLMYTLDPDAREQVALFQTFPHRARKPFYTVCSFASDAGVNQPAAASGGHLWRVTHYELQVTLKRNGQARCRATLNVIPARDGLRVATFDLLDEMEIDSVRTAAGDSLVFFREEDDGGVAVVLDAPTQAGQAVALSVYYHGRLFEEIGGNYLHRNKLLWYPRTGYLLPATFDVTYTVPKGMQVVSGGRPVKKWRADNLAHSRWLESSPVDAFAFAFGRFDSTAVALNDSLAIVVYSSKGHTKSVREKVAEDVAGSFYFFEKIWRGYPRRHLTVVETPGATSNGFAGILFLTRLTFDRNVAGVNEALRAHEASHLWWGNIVGWQTYRDQWLSEAFAEYSSALMNQFLQEDDDRFFAVLDGWRNDLLHKGHIGVSVGLRRFGFSKADLAQSDGLAAGPIWLGNRLGTKYPVDYFVNVYEKGAYVLHMLRLMLRDFETGSDARFLSLLARFVDEYRGQKASTSDFQRIVDAHLDQDMGWFFKQWVYGTDLPTYVYSDAIMPSNGGYLVALEVEQKNVPDDFRAFVPVSVSLPSGQVKTELVEIAGNSRAFKIGPFPEKPSRVEFNSYGGVLARVKRK